jgi:hypothetical protein
MPQVVVVEAVRAFALVGCQQQLKLRHYDLRRFEGDRPDIDRLVCKFEGYPL